MLNYLHFKLTPQHQAEATLQRKSRPSVRTLLPFPLALSRALFLSFTLSLSTTYNWICEREQSNASFRMAGDTR